MKYPHLAAQIFNVPLLARPETAEVFAQAFVQILAGEVHVTAPAAVPAREAFADNVMGRRSREKGFILTDSGIGVLPIYGALAQRAGEITPDCTELTSYQRLGSAFDRMVADADVKGILLEVDSPGGQVAGNFELARRIVAARSVKPVYAHANEIAFSGGYSLAAGAEKIFAPDTGMAGSIGVIMLHMSQAERDEKMGYKYTAIYAGSNKNNFNPHFPLSDDARAKLQTLVDGNYDTFVSYVAAARGIDEKSVRATEAAIYQARDALGARLIDGISTFQETLAALEARVKGVVATPGAGLAAHQPKEKTAMTDTTQQPAATTQNEPAKDKPQPPQVDAAKVAADARAAERARINGILGSDEAKGRPQLAQHLASETDMGVEDAKKLLAKAPLEANGGGKKPFERAMDTQANPNVGTGEGGAEEAASAAKRIAAHVNPKLS